MDLFDVIVVGVVVVDAEVNGVLVSARGGALLKGFCAAPAVSPPMTRAPRCRPSRPRRGIVSSPPSFGRRRRAAPAPAATTMSIPMPTPGKATIASAGASAPAVVWITPWSSLRGLEFCRGTHLQSEPRWAQVVNTDGSFEIMEASGHPHSGGPPSSTARVSVGLVCPKRCDQQCLRSIQHQGSSEILCRRCESVRNLSFTAVAESFFDYTRPSVIQDIISSSRNAPPN